MRQKWKYKAFHRLKREYTTEYACAKQTKHLGEVLGVLGKHTSQAD